MTTVKTPKQILLDAADILAAENAWTQGDYHVPCEVAPSGVSHCADGALSFAAGLVTFELDTRGRLVEKHATGLYDPNNEPTPQYEAYLEAYRVAGEHVRPGSAGGIIHYNDTDGRTQQEVVDALRGAAATL